MPPAPAVFVAATTSVTAAAIEGSVESALEMRGCAGPGLIEITYERDALAGRRRGAAAFDRLGFERLGFDRLGFDQLGEAVDARRVEPQRRRTGQVARLDPGGIGKFGEPSVASGG